MGFRDSSVTKGGKLFAGMATSALAAGFGHHLLTSTALWGYAAIVVAPTLEVLSHLFTHVSSELVPHLYEDMTSLKKSPSELNHDVRHLYLDALTETLEKGLVQLYNEPIAGVRQYPELSREAEEKLTELAETFRAVITTATSDETFAHKLSGGELTNEKLIQLLDEKNKDAMYILFDMLDDEHSPESLFRSNLFPHEFLPFFDQHFIPLVHLYFTQGLKDEHYRKARIAFEEMMAQETYRSLKFLRNELSELKNTPGQARLKIPVEQQAEVIRVIDTIDSPSELAPLVHDGIKNYVTTQVQK